MGNQVALSTSFSAKHNWDPIYSIEITKKYNLEYCQIYIGDSFNNPELINRVNNYVDINYIFHSNFNLEPSGVVDREIEIVKRIKSQEKKVVYHHSINASVEEALEAVKELNSRGITVLLENFYEDYDRLPYSVNSYIDILKKSRLSGLKLYPLIDFPRLFIDKAVNRIDPLNLTYKILDSVKELNYPLYTHLIDTTSTSQTRPTWCSIGDGNIPYRKIFSYIKKMGIITPLHILELEDEMHIQRSIDYLC